VGLEGLGKLKNSNDLIGNRTCDLPACSIVPQPRNILPLSSGWKSKPDKEMLSRAPQDGTRYTNLLTEPEQSLNHVSIVTEIDISDGLIGKACNYLSLG
jgi:hypothetical protein